MGIRCLTSFLKSKKLWQEHNLRDCKLIVDGTSLLQRDCDYSRNHGEKAYGGDYDVFAKQIKSYLVNYAKCNIRCYVIFGRQQFKDFDEEKRSNNLRECLLEMSNLKPNEPSPKIRVRPLLLMNVITDVFYELNIKYAISVYSLEEDIIALAKHFNCPILSYDSYFFLSDVPVVSMKSLDIDITTNSLQCQLYNRHALLRKFGLEKEMIPIFYLLLNKYLDNNYFKHFFDNERISSHYYYCISDTLFWLKKQNYDLAIKKIFKFIPAGDEKKCIEILNHAKENYINDSTKNIDVFLKYITDEEYEENLNEIRSNWFEYGLLTENISRIYIELHNHKIFFIYAQMEDFEQEDSFIPFIPILRYAFDLLTNFNKDSFNYVGRKALQLRKFPVTCEHSIAKPDYEVHVSPFENGWENLPDYFGHFLRETLPGLPMNLISELPADCRLFMFAIVWWKYYTKSGFKQDAYCLLLSYVMVGTVNVRIGAEDDVSYGDDRRQLESEHLFLDKQKITHEDCDMAYRILQNLYPMVMTDTSLFQETNGHDTKVLHPFAQFQNCLLHLCSLNKLCGKPYEPTIYHKVYNGSFIYNVFNLMKGTDEPRHFMDKYLHRTGTVLKFYASLCTVFERCIDSVRKNTNQ